MLNAAIPEIAPVGLPFAEWNPNERISGHFGNEHTKKWSNYEATATLQYNVPVIPGLSLKAVYNKYERHFFEKYFDHPYTLYTFKTTGTNGHIFTNEVERAYTRSDQDRLRETYEAGNTYQLNGIVTYNNTFGNHDIGALFVYEQSENNNKNFYGQVEKFISSSVQEFFAGSTDRANSTVVGGATEGGRISYVGRVNYGYAQKYLFEANFRYDGSVNFAPEHRWGFFPSASAAWRMSEENFFKNNVKFVDYLKLRASVGLLGNDAVGGWQWLQRYKFANGAQFGALSNGIQADVTPNRDITWEKR